MKKIKTLCLVCARSGSKGIKNKNIKLFNSKPLIYWTLKAAKEISQIDEIYVSTDSLKISKIVNEYRFKTPFIRPKSLASDNSPEIYTWRHALNFFKKKYNYLPKALLILPITSPLRKKSDVIKCLNLFLKKKCDVTLAVSESRRNPYYNMVKRSSNGYSELVIKSKRRILRRQNAPKIFDISTIAYVLKPSFVLRENNIFNGIVKSVIVKYETAIDIDEKIDFKIAKLLHKSIG